MPQTIDADDELGLADYLRIVRRRWTWVLLPLITILTLAAVHTLRQPARYCTTAQVLIADSEAQIAIQGDANVSVANRDLANEINIAYSDTVRLGVVELLGTEPAVTIDGESTSDILWFRACGATPDGAAADANTWAEVYVDHKQEQAAENISAAVTGFELRLGELRDRRQELRRDVETQLQRLAGTDDEAERASIRATIDLLEADLAVETELVDAQIETIARNITLLEMDSELARTGTARVIQTAAPPSERANAPLSRNLVLGALVGLVVGAVVALAADNLDRTIKTSDDVTGAPVLGAIPHPGRQLRNREVSLATMNHSGTPVAEAYQKVRTAIEFALLGRKLTSILITSPNQSEGKTTSSSNLAWAMSAVDHRVVLADVDFRRPRLHQVFGCRIDPGLSDNLLQQIPLNKLALRVDDDRRNLVIIPTGTRPPNPADFVASPGFSSLIRKLENEADLVILDAPPVLPVSDALSIARQVDAVIVVAKAGSTSRDQLDESLEALRGVGADVLGVCLVGVKSDPSRYGYGPSPEPRRRRQRPGPSGHREAGPVEPDGAAVAPAEATLHVDLRAGAGPATTDGRAAADEPGGPEPTRRTRGILADGAGRDRPVDPVGR
jgi:capsular exopolysaccharide synthesis family protein